MLSNISNQGSNQASNQSFIQKMFSNNSNQTSSNATSNQNKATATNANNYTSKIYLTDKNTPGFIQEMDYDDDGKISLEEFNQYCDEKGVSDADKQKLFEMMMQAKFFKKLKEEEEERQEEKKAQEKSKEQDEQKSNGIYSMEDDENSDEKITLDEYLKYCAENSKNTDETHNPKIKVEVEA